MCLTVCLLVFSTIILCNGVSLKETKFNEDFLLVTVASNDTDGYRRFIKSAELYGVPVKVLGMGKKWLGGDMNWPGGGYKIILLKEFLEKYKNDKNKIVMFTDSYDVVITGSVENIKHRFKQLEAGIVFSAESKIWPDKSLVDKYPVTESKYKYLNSGGFVGYASDLYDFIHSSKEILTNTLDDQYFYTKLFLDYPTREKCRVKLDYKANIFLNLFDALDDIELRFDDKLSYLENTKYTTVPLVIHGNGLAKVMLNSFTNYIPNRWTSADGCVACTEDRLTLPENVSDYPEVLISVFVTYPTPFMEEFFRRLYGLQYPKNKLHLFIYNSVPDHEAVVKEFIDSRIGEYKSYKQIKASDEIVEADARSFAIHQWEKKNCEYFLNVDAIAHLDNPNMLQFLMAANRKVIAPLFLRPYKAWSNFWGAINNDGFYQRSFDYLDIVNYNRLGIWNVPYISSVYLLNSTLLKTTRPSYHHDSFDPDMAFCSHLREEEIFMYVDNTVEYGHLVDPENFNAKRANPELYQLLINRYDWEQRYIHPEYNEILDPKNTIEQPCTDVFWFPITTARFCKELIEVMENFGKWSDGSNHDNRLDGGYENVPTRDIHMKQVGLDPTWLEILKVYVRPIQEHLFTGYFHDPPNSLMNFVVRYKPDEQPTLRPHHDSSTYTVNLALNTAGVDYTGGGCKFIRYNCSVVDTKLGWMLMHPGRLTHYHEGLEVTNGTRYIMISFVDP